MDVLRLLLIFKAIEIDTFLIVLAQIIANNHVSVLLLHDTAKPEIVMTIVVLDECIDTVVIGIKSSTIYSTFTQVSIGLIELDLDAISIEAENAVPGAVATAVSQSITFIDGIFADTSNDVVASCQVHIVISYIDFSPQVVADYVVLPKLKLAARG